MARKYKAMNPEVKAQWLEALRSGKFRQARYTLAEKKQKKLHYCCLGVLCAIDPLAERQRPDLNVTSLYAFVDELGQRSDAYLPKSVSQRAGLTNVVQAKLAGMNDDEGMSFRQIADWVEEFL